MKWRNLFLICFVSTIFVLALALEPRRPCRKRAAEYGYICVCDDNYCDTLDVQLPRDNSEYTLVTSSKFGDRFFYEKKNIKSPSNTRANNVKIEIDSTKKYQKINGFGGGYPGATTYLLQQMSPNMRKCVYRSYFSRNSGMNYNYLRIPIGGCDFDLEPWAYNEYPENDANLSNFTKLDQREVIRNEQLKELAQISGNSNVKLLAAAWSPPPWMKANHKFTALMNNQIKPEWYQTWADYHLKWLEFMENDGMNVWAVSTGNEPAISVLNSVFEETNWFASQQAKWIAEHFGPAIKNSKFSNVEIHGFDDSRFFIHYWLNRMNQTNPKVFDYISSFSFHGYTDTVTSPEILDEVQRKFPDKPVYYSEMCFGVGFADKTTFGPRLGLWSRAEDLIDILMNDFNHSTVAYFDWNMILNNTGGPNYSGKKSQADAPIILNSDYTEMYKQPMFYVMAHFSKFIPPGSVRIDVKLIGTDSSHIMALAFLRPDNNISVVIYNKQLVAEVITLQDTIKGPFEITLKPKSINTLIYTVGRTQYDAPKKSKPVNIFLCKLHNGNE